MYVFFTSSTTWVILSLMSFCVCSFLFGVHYKVSIEIQGLSSSNCNFQGILGPWIFNLKFKDFQGACEPWKLQCVLKNKVMISDVLSHSVLCILRQYEFATLSCIKRVIFRVQLFFFVPYWASNGPLLAIKCNDCERVCLRRERDKNKTTTNGKFSPIHAD